MNMQKWVWLLSLCSIWPYHFQTACYSPDPLVPGGVGLSIVDIKININIFVRNDQKGLFRGDSKSCLIVKDCWRHIGEGV